MPSRFGYRQFVSKWNFFFVQTALLEYSECKTFHISKNTLLNYSVCCGRRTVYVLEGMTISSRTINIYIWKPVEISSCCIRARTSLYFLDCTGLLFDLYKRIYIVNSQSRFHTDAALEAKTE